MNQLIKKVLLACSILFYNSLLVHAEHALELTYDHDQGAFQDFLNAQSGDVKVLLNSGISGSEISIPETISSLEIDLNGYSITSKLFANGIPVTISNGQTGEIYGGSHNADVQTDTSITLTDVRINGRLFGGGYSDSAETSANVNGTANLILNEVEALYEMENGQGVGNSYEIYGGGRAENGGSAAVNNTRVTISGGLLYSVYGGGTADTGSANVMQTSLMSINSATSYGDLVGCGNPVGQDSSTSCKAVDLTVEDTYFPASERIFGGLQSGLIVGGSLSYSDTSNLIGKVEDKVSVKVKNTSIYAEIIGSGLTISDGDFSVGSVDMQLTGIKAFYEPRLDMTISNEIICLGGALSNSEVHDEIKAVINDCDLKQIVVTEGDSAVGGPVTVEFQSASKIAGVEGIDHIILEKPIEITSYVRDPLPIQVELKGRWENGVKAILLGGVADDSLFTGSHLNYGEDNASYWITNGIEQLPEPDDSSDAYSGSNSDSKIVVGETETSVKISNSNYTLSERLVEKLAEENQKVPVVIESKNVRITYPKGTMTDMKEPLSVKVAVNGKDSASKKAAEAAEGASKMILNFTEEKMFINDQPIKIEVKAKAELKGKQLYYQKYDELSNQLVLVHPAAVSEDGWIELTQSAAGCYVLTDTIDPYWQKSVTGGWYYFDDQGSIINGWLAENSRWYYLNEQGMMHVGWIALDNTWYCTGEDGKMITGWNPQNDVWYYHDGSGSLVKNEWVWDAGSWYYMDNEGKMLKDGFTPDGYHVNASGVYDY